MEAAVNGIQKNGAAVCAIHGYTHDGMGVGRVDGRAVFVPGTARGDVVSIRFTKVTAGAVYGRLEELREASPWRIAPDCAAYPRCGGCRFRHIAYEEELRAKRERVEETLRRMGGVELRAEEMLAAPCLDHCRNKAAFPVGRDGRGEPVTGFYRERSNDIIPVEDCRLQTPEANEAARILREWLRDSGETGVRHLVTRGGTGGLLVCVVSVGKPGASARMLAETLRKRIPALCGVVWQRHSGEGNFILGGHQTLLWGREYTEDELCLPGRRPLGFRLSAKSFYQVNKAQAERLYARAVEYAGEFSSALDLYCGTGTLTLLAAQAQPGARVTGVEIVPEAVRDARENALRNGLVNAEFIEGDAGEAARRFAGRTEVVFLDPPRKGLSPETLEAVLRLTPARVVYMSCDTATLARDIKGFCEGGYRAERLTAADFFPRTPHVECVVLLTRS